MLGILACFSGNRFNQLEDFVLSMKEEAGGSEIKIFSNQTIEMDNIYTIDVFRNVSEVIIRRFHKPILTICEVQVFAGITVSHLLYLCPLIVFHIY